MSADIGTEEWRRQQAIQQETLNSCLRAFCETEISSTEQLIDIAKQLNSVYSDPGFRHRYSDILDVIYDIDCGPLSAKGLDEEAQ